MREWFGHIFCTVCGYYQHAYAREWDALLNQLLDEGCVVGADAYTLTLRHEGTYYTVWTNNWMYGFGHLYRMGEDRYRMIRIPDEDWRRPRFRTMLRLWDVYARSRYRWCYG